jgi:hypothetical protein
MKILILTAIPFWHPGTQELIDQLRERGIQVEALDIFSGKALDSNNNIKELIKLPSFLKRIYLKLFRKSFTSKHIPKDAIVDIHFVEPFYTKYILGIPNKLICTLFGSDLFRTNSDQKEMQKALFERTDRILLSQNMVPYFEEHFGVMKNKYIFNQYGSKRIDLVYKGLKTSRISDLRRKYKIDAGKIAITCGYNAKMEQQHIKIIDELNQLPKVLRDQIHVLFPLTYGGNQDYIDEIETKISSTGIDYTFFTKRLSDLELTNLRIVSQVSINTQTTDALASSVKEAFVAGDVLLVGDWLPYEIYQELGVFYLKTNFRTLTEDLTHTLKDIDNLQEKAVMNAEIIRNFASWNSLINQWVKDYESLNNEGQYRHNFRMW